VKVTQLTKVVNRRVEREIDYATPKGVAALLREYAEKRGLPLLRMLEILAEGRVNSVSFTKDTPYFHFYASANSNRATITINTDKGEYETTVDLSQFASGSSPTDK
jgi:hypothetical protein